jgi:O-antigen/teichoic acid export membrane protein
MISRFASYMLTICGIPENLARSSAHALLAAVANQGSTLVCSVLVARLLGKVALGEFALVNSTVTMSAVFAGAGLSMSATKLVPNMFTILRTVQVSLSAFRSVFLLFFRPSFQFSFSSSRDHWR